MVFEEMYDLGTVPRLWSPNDVEWLELRDFPREVEVTRKEQKSIRKQLRRVSKSQQYRAARRRMLRMQGGLWVFPTRRLQSEPEVPFEPRMEEAS